MTTFTNSHGLSLTKGQKEILIRATSNIAQYKASFLLDHLDVTVLSEDEKSISLSVPMTDSVTWFSFVRFSQLFEPVDLEQKPNLGDVDVGLKTHFISSQEVLSLLYLLPEVAVKEMTNKVYGLANKKISLQKVLSGNISSMILCRVVGDYLRNKSNILDGEVLRLTDTTELLVYKDKVFSKYTPELPEPVGV